MEDEFKKQIVKKRKELEEEIIDLLEKYESNFTLREDAVKEILMETKSNFSLKDIKDIIFNEGNIEEARIKIIPMFNCRDASDMGNVLGLIESIWNYFPHKALDGLSPVEIKWLKNKN